MKWHGLLIVCFGISLSVLASNEIDSETGITEGNEELPKILYVVPWKDSQSKKFANPKLVLHDLLGDLYEPQIASDWQ